MNKKISQKSSDFETLYISCISSWYSACAGPQLPFNDDLYACTVHSFVIVVFDGSIIIVLFSILLAEIMPQI